MDGVNAKADEQKSSAVLKLVLLVGLIATGIIAAKFTPLGAYLTKEGVLSGIEQLRGSPWAPLIFVAAYAAATTLAIPGTILTLAGGALFGFWLGTLLNVVGANLGANAAFLLARSLGRDGLTKLLGSRLDKLDKATDQHGFQGLLTLRLIPVAPFNALNFGAGLTSISWGAYALATLIGTAPGTAVYTFFGEALLQGSTEASTQAYTRVLIAGLLLVALSLLPRLLKSRGLISTASGVMLLGTIGAFMPTGLAAQTPTAVPDPAPFTALLREVVTYPRVDYAKLKEERARLDDYLNSLASVDPSAIAAAPRDRQLAFWMNAYNACMLKRVVDRYPIKRSGGIFSRFKNAVADRPANSVWQIKDVFTEAVCPVAGSERSQDEIEHELLRPLGEPRIHFAVNCAALSCPPLPSVAFNEAEVDEQLDARVRAFVADPHHLQIDREGDKVILRLNKVLEWYAEDFGGVEGVRDFLVPYLPPASREAVSTAEVQFMEYDWTLNDIPR